MESSALPSGELPRPGWGMRALAACLVLILLGGLALRIHDLGAADLTEDEELATGLPLLGYLDLFTGIAGRPPMAFFVQKLFIDVTGSTSPFVLRLPGITEGVLAIGVLYLLVRGVGGVRCALLAAALLATSQFHIEWSRDARYYPMLSLMAMVSLLGLWRGAFDGRIAGFALLAAGLLGMVLTHYAGYLFCTAVLVTLPLFAFLPQWRRLIMTHPRKVVGAGGALVLGGLLSAFILRGSLGRVTKHIVWPDLTKPLPPLFDVSPEFLGNRFAEVMGIPHAWVIPVLILVLIGFIFGGRRAWQWPIVSLSILVVPFVLFWLFPPQHAWNVKYFIFQLPVLIANAALGVEGLIRLLPKRAHALFGGLATVTVLAVLGAPNLAATLAHYNHPRRAHQQVGADLAAWSRPDDKYYCTWPERPRILRHYCPPLGDPTHLAVLDPGGSFPNTYPAGGAAWFLLDGKLNAAESSATALLSSGFSRVGYEGFFLATAPGAQLATFGQSIAGSPEPAGPLQLNPGEEHELRLLMPRDGTRAVTVEVEALTVPDREDKLEVRFGDSSPLLARLPKARGTLYLGPAEAVRGPVTVRLRSSSKAALRVYTLGAVPRFDGGPLILPAWDFLSLFGGEALNAVWPESRPEGILLRDMRHGESAAYRFYSQKAGKVQVRVRALNDAPFANRYQLYIEGTRLKYKVVSFPLEDGSISEQVTQEFELPRGLHDLYVGYIGVSKEDFLAATRGGRAQTEETLQNPGLLEVEIAGVGKDWGEQSLPSEGVAH